MSAWDTDAKARAKDDTRADERIDELLTTE